MFRTAYQRFRSRNNRNSSGGKRSFHETFRAESNPIKNVPGSRLLEQTVSLVKKWPIALLIPAGFAVVYFWSDEKKPAPVYQENVRWQQRLA
jgi:hypothetical protein